MDPIDQLASSRLLEYNPACAQLHGTKQLGWLDSGGQQDDACRLDFRNRQSFQAAHARHCDIKQQHVRTRGSRQLNGVQTVCAFRHHFEPGLALEQSAQAVSEDFMIIGDRNSHTLV
jgi:hypothetical protein